MNRMGTAWFSEEHDAERLGEAGCRQATDDCQAAADRDSQNKRPRRIGPHAAEAGEIDEELADESIEWRQSGDRRRSNHERHGGPAHRFDESTEMVDVPRAGAMNHRAGPAEQ